MWYFSLLDLHIKNAAILTEKRAKATGWRISCCDMCSCFHMSSATSRLMWAGPFMGKAASGRSHSWRCGSGTACTRPFKLTRKLGPTMREKWRRWHTALCGSACTSQKPQQDGAPAHQGPKVMPVGRMTLCWWKHPPVFVLILQQGMQEVEKSF